jgi:hypothetical protein
VRNGLLDLVLDAPKKDWNEHFLEMARKAEAAQAGQARKQAAQRHKDTRPSLELSAYAGNYENPAYGTLAVALEDGALVAQWSSFKVKLEHYHFDTFTARGDRLADDQLLTFTLDAEASVNRLTFLDQQFSRMKINAAPKN